MPTWLTTLLHFVEQHASAIAASGTLVIAVFTIILGFATCFLWWATVRLARNTKETADRQEKILTEQQALARRQFITSATRELAAINLKITTDARAATSDLALLGLAARDMRQYACDRGFDRLENPAWLDTLRGIGSPRTIALLDMLRNEGPERFRTPNEAFFDWLAKTTNELVAMILDDSAQAQAGTEEAYESMIGEPIPRPQRDFQARWRTAAGRNA